MLHYEISLSAEEDWREIVNYTLDQHGEIQTRKYMQELTNCIDNLANGVGHYKKMDDLHIGICLKHCQHHYIFGLTRKNKPMLIVAVFHERMDLIKQLVKRLNIDSEPSLD